MQNLQPVYLRAARNFGLGRLQLFRRVILPGTLPQILTGVRIALGVAWLVVVAAEMIAVNSGLGYLIIDARNAGKRYDLVVAGMVVIGLIGLVLDLLVRRLERFEEVSWGYGIDEIPALALPRGTRGAPKILDGQVVHLDPRPAADQPLSLRDLWMTFPGSVRERPGATSSSAIDLEVREGEFVCIVGPSGCGKTRS